MKNGNKANKANKALVFGGSGTIGLALIKRLKADGYYVINISLKNECKYADENMQMDISKMKLSDMINLSDSVDVNIVYHLATYSTTKTMSKEMLDEEADILKFIIEAFECSIRYASSYAVYDESIYLNNDIKINYRRAKQESEAVVSFYNGLDFDVVGYRIPAVYGGEHNTRAMYKVVQRLKENKEIVLDKDSIEFCYISDVVDSLRGTKGCWGGIVEIPAQSANLKTLVLRLKNEIGSTSNIVDATMPTQEEIDIIEHLLERIVN